MKKAKTVIYLSIFLALIPFLGFPFAWDRFFIVFIGIILFLIGMSNYRKEKYLQSKKKKNGKNNSLETPVFVESEMVIEDEVITRDVDENKSSIENENTI